MKLKMILFLGILIIPISFLYSQNINFEKIKGKWKNYRTEAIDGDTGEKHNLNGEPFKSKWNFDFINDKRLKVYDGIELNILNYKIQENKIFIGNRVFEIIKFEKDSFIAFEYLSPIDEDEDPLFKLFFKRVK